MRKTKSEGKTVGISQSVRKVANFAMQLRNWQGCCENSQCENSQCEIGKAVAKMKLALRNWQGCCENSQCEISQCEIGKAVAKMKLALRNWHCEIRKGCQHIAKISALLFFSSDFQYMLQNLHKTSKIKARKIA